MNARTALLLAVLLTTACGDGPVGPRAGVSYVLATVDGAPVPAVVDSAQFGESTNISRILKGAIELFSADSAVYMRASETFTRAADGTILQSSAMCNARPVAYRRVGNLLILHADEVVFPPSHGGGSIQGVNDTLSLSGSRLLHDYPVSGAAQSSTVELEYRPGRPPQPLC